VSDRAKLPRSFDEDRARQPEYEESDIPRHEFTAEHELHLFPIDMAEIACPDCEATYYPSDLGEALDWALGHACVGAPADETP
jgi:hypothetical protein